MEPINDPLGIIGKKCKGFKFEETASPSYNSQMDSYIDVIGKVVKYYAYNGCYKIQFSNDFWHYPAILIKDYLVEDTELSEEELLIEAARLYPIGTKYILLDLNGNSYCNVTTEAIREPVMLLHGIDVGVGYVYAKGKWAQIVLEGSKPKRDYEHLVGLIVSDEVLNAWAKAGKNYTNNNYPNWTQRLSSFQGSREIKTITSYNGVECFKVSGTSDDVYLRAEGFKEFRDSYTSKVELPIQFETCIEFISNTMPEEKATNPAHLNTTIKQLPFTKI